MKVKMCLMFGVLLALFYSVYAFADDNVWIINATGKPAWVYVTKKGRAGVDKTVKDIKQKLDSQNAMQAEGVNITDVYVWPSNDSSPSGEKVRDEAKKLGLHVSYKDQKRIYCIVENGKYKLSEKTNVSNKYPGWADIIAKADKDGSTESNPWVGKDKRELINKFKAIPVRGKKVSAWDVNNLIPDAYDASKKKVLFQSITEFLDIKDREEGWSHIQGVKRMPAWLNLGQYIILSSGQYTNFEPHLFVAKLDSVSASGALKSNDSADKKGDRVVAKIVIDKKPYWHPGGIDVCGKHLIVPISTWKTATSNSKFVIYDISNPEKPLKVVESPHAGNLSAAALTRLPNNYYLLALLNGNIEMYYSKSTTLADGFYSTPTVKLPKGGLLAGGAQNINFVTAGDGTLMMTGSANTKETSPIINGEDHIDLYEITYDIQKMEAINKALKEGKTSDLLPLDTVSVNNIDSKRMYCSDDHCNFNSAADLDIVSRNSLGILAAYHWAEGDKFRMTIFSD
jgi:hypothetical protein